MRHRPKLDKNQSEIVDALESVGCSVQSLASIGSGCPDLLLSRAQGLTIYSCRSIDIICRALEQIGGCEFTFGTNIVMEIKNGNKGESKTQLTDDQKRWHSNWRGPIEIAYSIEDALKKVGITG